MRTTASDFPGSTGLYRGVSIIYDVMGRVMKQSNATEIDADRLPAGDDATWIYTQQDYDYKGRPTTTTNQDGTTRLLEYDSCGCAGGDTVTSTDEVGRKQKVYNDTLAHALKTEILNANNSVYSTVKNTYNIRDQVTNIRQYQGSETSSTFQDTVMTYDGHARLSTRKTPIEDSLTAGTTYLYNADDTVQRL